MQLRLAGILRPLCSLPARTVRAVPRLVGISVVGYAVAWGFGGTALAAGWEWSIQPQLGRPGGVEQVRIELDSPVTRQELNHSRTGTYTISFSMPQGPASLERSGNAPADGALVRDMRLDGTNLVLETGDPAFGYVVGRPSDTVIVLTVTPDPLGARWTPSGPAATAEQAAEQRQAAVAPAPVPAPAEPATPPAPAETPPAGSPAVPERPAPIENSASAPVPDTPAPVVPVEAAPQPRPIPVEARPAAPSVTPAMPPVALGDVPARIEIEAPSASPVPLPAPAADLPVAEPVVPGMPDDDAARQAQAVGDALVSQVAEPTPPSADISISSAPRDIPAEIPVTERPASDNPAADAPAPSYAPLPDVAALDPALAASDAATPASSDIPSPLLPGESPVQDSSGGLLLPPDSPQDVYGVISLDPEGTWVSLSDAPARSAADGVTPENPDGDGSTVAPAADTPPAEPVLLPEELLEEARKRMDVQNYGGALAIFYQLAGSSGISRDIVEEALYGIADIEFHMNRSTLSSTGDEVARYYDMALGYNTKSPRAVRAYARLGQIYLKLGNREAAKAMLRAIDNNFPGHMAATDILFDLATEASSRGDYVSAVEWFQRIYDEFSEAPLAREAAMGLARSLHGLEYFDQELQLLDEFAVRWPDYYASHPDFLLVSGDAYYQMRKNTEARNAYMRYVNIVPLGTEADIVLTRVGDTLLADGDRDAAKIMFEFAASRYPTNDGGLVAQMRLAREFSPPPVALPSDLTEADPTPPIPPEIYRTIRQVRPANHWLVPLARLDLALWYYNQQDHPEAIRESADFITAYPDHARIDVAQSIMANSYMDLVTSAVQRQNYGLVVKIWHDFPQLVDLLDRFSPQQLVALATAFSKENQYEIAVYILQPLLGGYKDPQVGEQALALALSIYAESFQWAEIVDMATRIAPWELTSPMQNKLDYALALALENENKGEQAQALWENLEDLPALGQEERANVLFFMARQAEKQRDQLRGYTLYQEALALFREIAQNSPDRANLPRVRDCLTGLMNISEEAGRIVESLEWATQFLEFVNDSEDSYYAHLFRMARLHQKINDLDQWRAKLMEIIEKRPDSYYARMAEIQLRSATMPGLQ